MGQTVYLLEGFVVGYARKAMYIQDITHHPYKHTIEHRLKVMAFYDDYGAEATARAFTVSRSTVFAWKQRLKTNQGRLSSLAPASRKPNTFRQGQDYSWHRQQIITLRTQHPGLGKDKLQVLLNKRCRRYQHPELSVSTVGRLVTKLQATGQLPSRHQLSFLARTGRLTDKKRNHPKLKKARRNGF